MTTSPVQPGDVLANKYRVERVLGVGGMGVVVQATHVQLEERVALKFMLPEAMANPEVAGRFLREARLAVKLKSEHVAKVMDVGTLETGSPYIVMEYLQGHDLNDQLEKQGPLPFADVAEYVIQACDAVAEAHSLGIVHRDLKPANLFLTRRPDGAPLVKVLDFGISKASNLGEAAGGMTKTSTMMGSPYFMSPEQMRSAKDVDARSDVWSMGVILYQLVTARLPFESDTLGGIMAAILQDDPAMLASFRPDVPPAFEAIVRRCLVRDRNARTQNVGEIALALAAFAPARARPIADRIVSLLGGSGGTDIMPSPIPRTGAGTAPGAITGSGRVLGAGPITGAGAVLGAGPITGAGPGLATGAPVTAVTQGRSGKGKAGILLGAIAAGMAIGGIAFFASRGAARPAAPPPAESVAAVAETTAPAATAPGPSAAPTTTAPGPSASATAVATTEPPRSPVATGEPPKPTPQPVAPRGARPGEPPRLAAQAPRPSAAPAASAAPKKSLLDDRN